MDTTLDVKNDRLEELIEEYSLDNSRETLNLLITEIRRCHLLVPAVSGPDDSVNPCCIRTADGQFFLPAFTSKEQIPEDRKSPFVANIPYDVINHMALEPRAGIAGVVINPFTSNLILKQKLLERVEEVINREAGADDSQVFTLNEQQYHIFSRKQMEFGTLPSHFFTDGKAFMEELCEEREACIDRLFRGIYQEEEIYPYPADAFSVMVLNIREDLTVLRIDCPEQHMEVPSCYRIYLTWDPIREKGRYFTVEKTAEEEVRLLGELDAALKHTTHGEAPVEGTELQKIIAIEEAGAV